jgi:GAF domain-containing protein
MTARFYQRLSVQAEGLLSGQKHRIANAANLSALLFLELADINWVGFYFVEDDRLILGPFQGNPACVSIPLGSGVCGSAAASGQTLRVDDVHAFDGHIVCDIASNSEIVIPLFDEGRVIGVLDVDSPLCGRFSEEDQKGLEGIARIYTDSVA